MTTLRAKQLPRLDEALRHNEPLLIGYLLKELLALLWLQPSAARMADFLGHWCRLAAGTGIRALQTMAKTLAGHATGILNWWQHRISNGRMEGINNKIKATLRLLGLHETKFKLTGC